MKPIEVNIDKYELEEVDIKEAITDLMKKRGMGEVVKVRETKHHIPGNHFDDEGHDVIHYIVEVKRKGDN